MLDNETLCTKASALPSLPILDLSRANDPVQRPLLLKQLHNALFDVGFLYIVNHEVPSDIISGLASKLPALFDLPLDEKKALSKLNSPHFLGYSGFAEETTLGKQDMREQFDMASELPIVARHVPSNRDTDRDFSKLYWYLRGPNQWPPEELVPGFKKAFADYHDALQDLSYRFVHLIEEAFSIPVGTFDHFFGLSSDQGGKSWLPPQHRIKLIKYPPSSSDDIAQGVGAHKDSSGWLTFLYQHGTHECLEIMDFQGEWVVAPPIENSFVVNFGNAMEAATEGAVKATVHRAPHSTSEPRYSIPFFQGLPLDMTISEVQSYIPESVRKLRKHQGEADVKSHVSSFLDSRWDSLGESQLRKWIRSHQDVGRRWYGDEATNYYLR